MDAKLALLLGEWLPELEWIRRELASGNELRLSRTGNLYSLITCVKTKRGDETLRQTQWAPWVTLAVVTRFFRANGGEPVLFPPPDPSKPLDPSKPVVVLSAQCRGLYVTVEQEQPHGLLFIVCGWERKYRGRLETLNVLQPNSLVNSRHSLAAFLTAAVAAKAAATPSRKAAPT